MKVIIAGSRKITNYEKVKAAIEDAALNPSEVVSGGAYGVDSLGEKYAKENNIPIKVFPANWELHGKSAGYKRNKEMAEYANGLIAIWNGKSKGTKHMIDLATKNDLIIRLYIYE